MRFFVLFWCLSELAVGQQLHVKSASAHSVQLEWTGASGAVTLERESGGSFQKIATVSQTNYQDSTINGFATYRYRILEAGKPSNEVTVGPPPAGIFNVAPVPKGSEPGKYGLASAIALDENGDPVIAFDRLDPNGDGDNSDSDIEFVRWSRSEYRWLEPRRVQVVGDIATQGINPFSIAYDRKTGLVAMVTPLVDKGAMVLISKDSGTTWNGISIPDITATVNSTAMAISDAKIYLALTIPGSGAYYFTGPIEDPSSWTREALPATAGWKQALSANIGLILDSSGKPIISWYETQEEGGGRRFETWRPGGKAVAAVETKQEADPLDLSLAAGAGKIGLLFETPLDEKDSDHGVWYTQSSDGASWSKPSKLPVDGPRSTNPPLSVAIDSHGRISAVFGANSGTDSTTCNYPVLSRSNDGFSWKTCGPGKAEGGDFTPQPTTLHIIEADNDKAYILWREVGENKFHEGMLLWHEH